MREFDEKRDYIRMDIDCDVTYRLVDSETIYQGRGTSISGAGVSFIADHDMVVGQAVEIMYCPLNHLHHR